MVIKPTAITFFLIILYAATAEGKGWRGIVPLHSTRSQVEQLLGPPTEENSPYSVVYKTPNETVLIYYAKGRPCGIGEKYSRCVGFAFVDNAGHFGGLVGGLFLGWLFLRKNEWINEKEKLLELGGAAALVALVVISAIAVYRMIV